MRKYAVGLLSAVFVLAAAAFALAGGWQGEIYIDANQASLHSSDSIDSGGLAVTTIKEPGEPGMVAGLSRDFSAAETSGYLPYGETNVMASAGRVSLDSRGLWEVAEVQVVTPSEVMFAEEEKGGMEMIEAKPSIFEEPKLYCLDTTSKVCERTYPF